jgi:hypothetical protein
MLLERHHSGRDCSDVEHGRGLRGVGLVNHPLAGRSGSFLRETATGGVREKPTYGRVKPTAQFRITPSIDLLFEPDQNE